MSLIKVNQLSSLDNTSAVSASTGLNIPASQSITISGPLRDSNGSVGLDGQFLAVTNSGAGVVWANLAQPIGQGDSPQFSNLVLTGDLTVQGVTNFDLSSFSTDDLVEGVDNRYYTDERVDDRVAALITSGTGITASYDDTGNVLSLSVDYAASVGVDNTFNEDPDLNVTGFGSFAFSATPTPTYVYQGPTRANFRESFSGETTGSGYGSLSYDSETGTFSYTGVTNTQIRGTISLEEDDTNFGSLTYSSTTGKIGLTGVSSANIRSVFEVQSNSGSTETDPQAELYQWGSLLYDQPNGKISYAGLTTGNIRSLFSAGGDLAYDASTGQFSVSLSDPGVGLQSLIYQTINEAPSVPSSQIVTDGLKVIHVNNSDYQVVKFSSIVISSVDAQLVGVGTINAVGHPYKVGDRIKLENTGNDHLNGIYPIQTSATDSFTIQTKNVTAQTLNSPVILSGSLPITFEGSSGYSNAVGVSTLGVNGSGLTVDITTNNGTVTGITLNDPGDGEYENGEELIINQAGSSQDATFTIFVPTTKRQSTFTGDLVIEGSLNVNGSKIGLSDLFVGTNLIRLNSDLADQSAPATDGTDDAIIEVNRGLLPETSIRWNEATGRWQFTNNGITYNNFLLPSETDFGAPEEFGASGDPNRYAVTALTNIIDQGNNTRTVITLNPGETEKFRPTQFIKMYGASNTTDLNSKFLGAKAPNSLDVSRPNPIPGDDWCYAYATAEMDINDDPASGMGDISAVKVNVTPLQNNNPGNLNEETYNIINLERSSTDRAVLIYRFAAADPALNAAPANQAITDLQAGNNRENWQLIAVVGPKYFGNNGLFYTYNDYGTYDVTRNSLRNQTGAFGASEIDPRADEVHVPHIAPINPRHGFVTSQIISINAATNEITLTAGNLTENISQEDVYIYHDDTDALQNAIDDAKVKGRDFLVIPGGTYLITQLSLPDKFTLRGLADATILHRQYWNFDKVTTGTPLVDGSKGNMLLSQKFDGSTNTPAGMIDCSIGDIVFDGSAKYQVLCGGSSFDSGIETQTNDAVVNAINSEFFRMTNVKIRQSTGPALVAGGCENLSVDGCVFFNGSDVERFTTPCIVADEGDTTIISNCVFRDFPGPLIFNSTNVLAVNGCTIRNCDTGLRIYGASKTDVLNNLILGPADEYIPVPDNYDSDFNGVNLITDPNNSNNYSPILTYIEGGEALDLTNINIQAQVIRVTVTSELDIEGNAIRVENFDFLNPIFSGANNVIESTLSPFIDGSFVTVEPSLGQVCLVISQTNLAYIRLNYPSTPNAYNVYRCFGIRYAPVGSDTEFTIKTSSTENQLVSNDVYAIEVEKSLYDAVTTTGTYLKLVSHVFSPNVVAPNSLVWEVVNKQVGVGPTYVISLAPRNEKPDGTIEPLSQTLTTVGASQTTGGGYVEIRNTFTIAKGIVSLTN